MLFVKCLKSVVLVVRTSDDIFTTTIQNNANFLFMVVAVETETISVRYVDVGVLASKRYCIFNKSKRMLKISKKHDYYSDFLRTMKQLLTY